jgi:hypothetical protein
MSRLLKRRILFSIFSFLGFIILFEFSLRFFLGLGNPPLYIHHNAYQYIYAPNQDVIRFGARTITNSYSMRSYELSENEIRILKIGDSIVHGGALIDHDSLASSLLEKKLQSIFTSNVRVLNISSGGWSPEHELAYLKVHGTFDAKLILVEWNGNDLYSKKGPKKIVGIDPNIPEQKPLSAIVELFNRYIIPEFVGESYKFGELEFVTKENLDNKNEDGILGLINFAKNNKIPLIVYLHPNKKELFANTFDIRSLSLLELLHSNNVTVYSGLDFMRPRFYRDDIHLNEEGNRAMSTFFTPIICDKFDSLNTFPQ